MKMIFFKQNSQKYGPLFETMISPFVNDCTKIPTNAETLQKLTPDINYSITRHVEMIWRQLRDIFVDF